MFPGLHTSNGPGRELRIIEFYMLCFCLPSVLWTKSHKGRSGKLGEMIAKSLLGWLSILARPETFYSAKQGHPTPPTLGGLQFYLPDLHTTYRCPACTGHRDGIGR